MDIIETIDNFSRALTVEELAGIVAVSEKTLYRHIRAGKLKAIKIGGQLRLNPKTTADWLRQREG